MGAARGAVARVQAFALAGDEEWATALDLVITPELRAEGAVGDLIRSLGFSESASI